MQHTHDQHASVKPAAWILRVLALIVDGMVVFTIALPFIIMIGNRLMLSIVWVLLVVGYGTFLPARQGRRNGQTLGKQLLGLRVICDDAQPLGWRRSLLREGVAKWGVFWLSAAHLHLLPWLVDSLTPLVRGDRRSLHDLACRTRVVEEPRTRPPQDGERPPGGQSATDR